MYPGQQYQQNHPQQPYAPPPQPYAPPPQPYAPPQTYPAPPQPYAPPNQSYAPPQYAPPAGAPPHSGSFPYGQPTYAPPPPPSGYPAQSAYQGHQYTPPPAPPGLFAPGPGQFAPPPGPPPPAHSGYPAPYPAPAHPPPPGGYQYQMPTATPQWTPPAGVQQYSFSSPCNGRKKALLIGINYFGQKGELKGCINDVKNIRNFLCNIYRFPSDSNSMLILTDDQNDWRFRPTRDNITSGMSWLAQGARPGDSLVLHYSGHGAQQADRDMDESDGMDETICPLDYTTKGMITDDEMNNLVVRSLPAGVRLTAIFDSCHSGSVLDLPFTYLPTGQLKTSSAVKKLASSAQDALMKFATHDVVGAGMSLFKGLQSTMNHDGNKERQMLAKGSAADVVMLSGCKDSQTSADTYQQGFGATGAMSYAIVKALSMYPNESYAQMLTLIRDILRQEYSQTPQLSTSRYLNLNERVMF
ncbi:caspase domain-containing protein [Cladochytrium replicatum]|nr:caspase domain-containing protein [Cladochytrium replicatum]